LLTQGAIEQAEEAAREGLHLATGAQDPWATGLALLQLGKTALAQHRLVEARYLVEESIAIFGEIGEPWGRGMALVALGWIAQAEDKAAEAQACWEEAVELGRATHLEPVMLNAQFGLAYLRRADTPAALALLDPIIAHPAAEHHTREQAMLLRTTLTVGEGSAITILPSRMSSTHVTPTGETLTPREVEVLQLLAEGHSNQSIAEELVVAVGTVKRHVNNILGKLDVQSRLEAVARARKLGLI
jgi:DNA-binding CsgD family transcriptional regulator